MLESVPQLLAWALGQGTGIQSYLYSLALAALDAFTYSHKKYGGREGEGQGDRDASHAV